MSEWKRGMPPGKYYDGMIDDYEVHFTIGGIWWHRKRTDTERDDYLRQRAANHAAAKAAMAGVGA